MTDTQEITTGDRLIVPNYIDRCVDVDVECIVIESGVRPNRDNEPFKYCKIKPSKNGKKAIFQYYSRSYFGYTREEIIAEWGLTEISQRIAMDYLVS